MDLVRAVHERLSQVLQNSFNIPLPPSLRSALRQALDALDRQQLLHCPRRLGTLLQPRRRPVGIDRRSDDGSVAGCTGRWSRCSGHRAATARRPRRSCRWGSSRYPPCSTSYVRPTTSSPPSHENNEALARAPNGRSNDTRCTNGQIPAQGRAGHARRHAATAASSDRRTRAGRPDAALAAGQPFIIFCISRNCLSSRLTSATCDAAAAGDALPPATVDHVGVTALLAGSCEKIDRLDAVHLLARRSARSSAPSCPARRAACRGCSTASPSCAPASSDRGSPRR